ncbi:MAG: AMP-binding protein [Candidimonas sp.]|nr:MAG: AMP-binding protein [Candidimonas sp.]
MNDHQYPELYSSYRWSVPAQFSLAWMCAHRWAVNAQEGRRIAIYFEDEAGQREVWTYSRLSSTANQLANGLIRMGVAPGDRVAIIMAQRPELAAALVATLSTGAIAVPLSSEFGLDAVGARLRDAHARVAIVDNAAGPTLLDAQPHCPGLKQVIGLGFQHDSIIAWRSLLARQPHAFKSPVIRSSDPALLLYTAGTQATLKGAVLTQASLIGSLPGFVASQNWFPKPADVFWTPSGWTRAGGLMGSLLPTLYFGRPIVATLGRFSPTRAFSILERYRVTNAFLPPSALRLMMHASNTPRIRYRLALRAIATAGESLGGGPFEWCQKNLGLTPNETFGQVEMNTIIGNSSEKWPAKAGSMGRPYPGHRVAVLDDTGKPCLAGRIGDIALNRYDIHGYRDPVLFSCYWNDEAITKAKFRGDWCLTGDLASIDDDGHYWHHGRRDEAFTSHGHLINPREIEMCLSGHKAVAHAAVIAVPNEIYGMLVKAYVVLKSSHRKLDMQNLSHTLQHHVRNRLAPWQMPQTIEFVPQLPQRSDSGSARYAPRARTPLASRDAIVEAQR